MVNPSCWKGCVWGQAGLLLLHALFFNRVSVDLYLSAVVTCQKTLRTTDLNRSNWILPRNKQQENKYFFVSHCRDDHYRYITTTWCVVSPALEEQGAAFGVACSGCAHRQLHQSWTMPKPCRTLWSKSGVGGFSPMLALRAGGTQRASFPFTARLLQMNQVA